MKLLFAHTVYHQAVSLFFYQQDPEGLTLPDSKAIHTMVPQCVRSPILFTLHTNDRTSPSIVVPSTFNLTFSDDNAILGLWTQTLKLLAIWSTVVSLKTPREDNQLFLIQDIWGIILPYWFIILVLLRFIIANTWVYIVTAICLGMSGWILYAEGSNGESTYWLWVFAVGQRVLIIGYFIML